MADPGLGEGFNRFYDPNGWFHGDQLALLGWMDRNRFEDVTLHAPDGGAETLTSRKQIAVELAHCMLVTAQNVDDWTGLDLSKAELGEAVELAEFGAAQTVAAVDKGVAWLKDWLKGNNETVSKRVDVVDPRDILLSGSISAAAAHRGQLRKNEKQIGGKWEPRPYFEHVAEVAAILGIAWRRAGVTEPGEESDLLLRLLQYRGLTHDGFEDSMSSDKHERGKSFLNTSRLLTSPLYHQRHLQQLLQGDEFGDRLAMGVAMDNFFLSKPVGRDGRMKFQTYITDLLGRPWAELTKLADMHYNRNIDPEVRTPENESKVISREADYEKGQRRIVARLSGTHFPIDFSRIVEQIPTVTKGSLQSQRSYRILKALDYDLSIQAFDEGQRAA